MNKTLTDNGSARTPRLDVQLWLSVIHGNDRGKRFRLEFPTITVGRSPEALIVLDDQLVSRVHCKLVTTSIGLVKVFDNNSHNGTFVDEERVDMAILTPQSSLRLGSTVLRVEHKALEEIRIEEELFTAATTDALTRAPNRRLFLERAHAEVAHAKRHEKPLAVVFVDIDHFKAINDSFGHAAGDAVLRDVADRMREAIREEDLWCRYGGEEFVVLLRETPLADALHFCERIRTRIEDKPSTFNGEDIPVTISVGVTEVHADDALEDLLQRADMALYDAKNQGRNRVVSNP